jgi:hypothetical protein
MPHAMHGRSDAAADGPEKLMRGEKHLVGVRRLRGREVSAALTDDNHIEREHHHLYPHEFGRVRPSLDDRFKDYRVQNPPESSPKHQDQAKAVRVVHGTR